MCFLARTCVTPFFVLLLTAVPVLLPQSLLAQDESPSIHPIFSAPHHDPEPSSIDFQHIRAALRFEPERQRLFGVARFRVRILEDSLDVIPFRSNNLEIFTTMVGPIDSVKTSVPSSIQSAGFLDIALDSISRVSELIEIQIMYAARPEHGLYFQNLPQESDTLQSFLAWTDSFPGSLSHWIPSPLSATDKVTSEVLATVPSHQQVMSTGRLVDTTRTEDGLIQFHYIQEKQQSIEHLGFVTGPFTVQEQHLTLGSGFSFPYQVWTLEPDDPRLVHTLDGTADAIHYFSDFFGGPFPWPQYTQIVLPQLRQKMRSFAGYTLIDQRTLLDERALLDINPNSFTAEWVAAQWIETVLQADFEADQWLIDALMPYMAIQYIADQAGEEAKTRLLLEKKQAYKALELAYQRPLVWNQWEDPLQLKDGHHETLGPWVFHQLASLMGDIPFRNALRALHRNYGYQLVNTDDLNRIVNDVSTGNFDRFFDDWVFSAGYPQVNITYAYDILKGSLTIETEQTQNGFLIPGAFHMTLPVEIGMLGSSKTVGLAIDSTQQVFEFELERAPRFVAVNPGPLYFADFKIEQGPAALIAQVGKSTSLNTRLKALQDLGNYTEDPALFVGLQGELASAQIPLLRAELLDVLARLPKSEDIKRVLQRERDHASPLVQRAALRALIAHSDSPEEALKIATETAESASSYLLQAEAVRIAAEVTPEQAQSLVQAALITPSYDDIVRQTAFSLLPQLELTTRQQLDYCNTYINPNNSFAVRYEALKLLTGLASLGNREATGLLGEQLTDIDPAIRQAAASLIGDAGLTELLPNIEEQLANEIDPFARLVSQQSLQLLAGDETGE